jgi:hypothetical protein
VSYEGYIAWRRLSHNGKRTRADLTPEQQREWDDWGFKGASLWPDIDQDEARRRYEQVTQGRD